MLSASALISDNTVVVNNQCVTHITSNYAILGYFRRIAHIFLKKGVREPKGGENPRGGREPKGGGENPRGERTQGGENPRGERTQGGENPRGREPKGGENPRGGGAASRYVTLAKVLAK